MLQCEGAFCGVWQHATCVRQHMRSMPVTSLQPNSISRQQFFCERCRIARADPFWEIFDATVMPPAVADKLVKNGVVINQMQQQMNVSRISSCMCAVLGVVFQRAAAVDSSSCWSNGACLPASFLQHVEVLRCIHASHQAAIAGCQHPVSHERPV